MAVNEGKTKYILSLSRGVRRIDFHIIAHKKIWLSDTVNEFIYLGFDVTTKNYVSLEIKCSITLANRCYYDLNEQYSALQNAQVVNPCFFIALRHGPF